MFGYYYTAVAVGWGVSREMIGQTGFYTAQLGNSFQLLVASRVAWHGEYLVVPCHAFVLLYYLSGNIQQSDIGFRVGFLSSGDNP